MTVNENYNKFLMKIKILMMMMMIMMILLMMRIEMFVDNDDRRSMYLC